MKTFKAYFDFGAGKSFDKFLLYFTTLLICLLFYAVARAQVAVSAPSDADLFSQILVAAKGFGGLSFMGKISAVCLILVALMKVSFLKPLWDKIGAGQALIAPLLGLIIGIVSSAIGGHLSLPAILAYLAAGAGALMFHELLDVLKAMPFVGPKYVAIINFFESILGAPPVVALVPPVK